MSLYVAGICAVLYSTALADDHAADVVRSLEAWNSAAEAVWSYDVYASITVHAHSKSQQQLVVAGEHELRQRFSLGKWRVDLLRTQRKYTDRPEEISEAANEPSAYAFDGKQIRYFSHSNNFGQVQDRRTFSPAKLLAPQLFEMFKAHFGGEPFLSMLRDRAARGTMLKADSTVLLDLPVDEAALLHTFWNLDFQITLAPSAGWQPIHIRYGQELGADASPFFVEYSNDFEEVAPRVWAPIRCTKAVHSKAIVGDAMQPAGVTEIRIDRERSQFNVDIPPEVFEMAFPPGALVYDASSGQNYVQSQGSEKDYRAFDELVRQKVDSFEERRPGAVGTSFRKATSVVLIVVNGLIVAGLLFIVLRRRS